MAVGQAYVTTSCSGPWLLACPHRSGSVMSDLSREMSRDVKVSAVVGRLLPFDDGLTETQPIDLDDIARGMQRATLSPSPPVAA